MAGLTSLTLADSVYAQLVEQLGPNGKPPVAGAAAATVPAGMGQAPAVRPVEPPTMVFK